MADTNSLKSVTPEDFPRVAYNRVIQRVYSIVSEKMPTPILDSFHDAWLAVAYRFFACAEHDTAYQASVRRVGSDAPRLEHYIQEKELFGFFVNGLTVIESFYYSCYSLAAILGEENFPMSNPKSIQPSSATEKFIRFYSNEPLTQILSKTKDDNEYKEWSNIRNILAHRILPPRQITVALWPPQANPLHEVSWTENNIPLNINTTASRRAWLARVVDEFIVATEDFTSTYFK